MKFSRPLLITFASLLTRHHASAFMLTSRSSTTVSNLSANGIVSPRLQGGCVTSRHFVSQSHGLSALPTADDVSTDDFMKQLGHASQIIPLLHPQDGDKLLTEDESTSLLELLSRQLGHSDGIRGFFAVYLTSPESLIDEDVPSVLAEAVRSADTKVMVPLACMNVIMPTAMSSIHEDAELKECASKTASSGKKILRLLKGNDDVVRNCEAISRVCQGTEAERAEEGAEDLIEYWEKFFVNYKYEEQQRKDIAHAVSEFC